MQKIISGLLFVLAACVIGGCANSDPYYCDMRVPAHKKPAVPSVATQAANTAVGKTWIMQSGGVNVLKLTAPTDINCVIGDGTVHFKAAQYEVEFWLVPGVQTVDDAVGRVSTQIVNEFKDFKPDKTSDLTVAGSAAKRLVGAGHEADDGDPGDADVIVFKLGDRVFVACNHGESLNPVGQQGMLTLVQTAQLP